MQLISSPLMELERHLQTVQPVSRLRYLHIDDSYYLIGDVEAGERHALDRLASAHPVASFDETVVDHYFEPPDEMRGAIESVRVRSDSNASARSWVIAKLGSTPRNGELHRDVVVFEYHSATLDALAECLRGARFKFTFSLVKRRRRFTLFALPVIDQGRQAGRSVRVTLDEIQSVTGGSATLASLRSTRMLEIERSADGLPEADAAKFDALRADLLSAFSHDALVPKTQSKFWHLAGAPAPSLAKPRRRNAPTQTLGPLTLEAGADELAEAIAQRRNEGSVNQRHPLGFWRLPITARGREDNGLYLHVWPRQRRAASMGSVHVHIFDLRSRILCGQLTDLSYSVLKEPGHDTHLFDVRFGEAEAWHRVDLGSAKCALVETGHYGPGDAYSIAKGTFHRTLAGSDSLTATLMLKTNVDLTASPFLVERQPALVGVVQPKKNVDAEEGWAVVDEVLARL